MMVERERQGVLVSVIGAGNYKEVEYILAGRGSSRSSFATWALKELLQDEETFDEVLIFGVKGAAWHLVDSHLPEARKAYLPEVKTQQEVDEGFLLIEKTLREFQSPSLTLDLTHGYRHHVMLILLTTFYLSMLEHLSLEGIYYAMLPYREEQAQFLDLMPFFSLLKTVVRVKTFQETMHATGISDLREELQRVRNAFGRRKEVDRASAVGKVE
ncbi:MAG TPA: hypothetical protein EYP10_04635, partial [Armatimonadetes bacterium]|nr:hypothetical protein [Armatimonadota bacterium]